MTSEDRSKIRARIRQLQERKTARGFSEAEAVAAAEKAAELMEEFGLTEDDLEIDRRESSSRGGAESVRGRLWGAVAMAVNCTATFTNRGGDRTIIWIGREPGPEVAVYLQAMLDRALNREVAEFRKGKFYRARRSSKTKSQAVLEFTDALVDRLCWRVVEMFAATRSAEAMQAAAAARDKAFPRVASVKPKKIAERFAEARFQGDMAGGRVGIRRGVGEDGGPDGALERPRLQIEGPR